MRETFVSMVRLWHTISLIIGISQIGTSYKERWNCIDQRRSLSIWSQKHRSLPTMVDAVPPTHPEPNKASAPDDYEDLVARAFIAMSAGTPQLHLIQNPPGAFHSSAKETASMGIPWTFAAMTLHGLPTALGVNLTFLGASHSIAIWTTSHFLSTTISRPPPCPDPFAADYETAQLQSTKSTCVLPYPSPPWNICSLVTQPTLSCLKLWAEINRRSSTIAHGPLAAR